jgi:hypothetical protein
MRTPIGLADLATAITTLDASPEVAERIVRLLGLAPAPEERRPPKAPELEDVPVRAEQPEEGESVREPERAPTPGESQPIATQTQLRLTTTPLERAPVAAPAWLKTPIASSPRRSAPQTPPPFEPLLDPRLTAAILVSVLRTWHRDGAVDSDALAGFIARQRPPTRVPRLLQPTLRMGVEVLVDRGDGMAPFEADVEHLIAAIRRVAGAAVSVRSFEDTPLVAGTGPRRLWTTYRLPAPGTAVVALTDLGIAHPSLTLIDEWRALSEQLKRRGCPLVAFVPWPKRRHPRSLRRIIPIVVWDRSTTLSSRRATRLRARS